MSGRSACTPAYGTGFSYKENKGPPSKHMGILDKLKPQPRWKHAVPTVRLEAVRELDDHSELAGLAESDPDARVRRAAVARIADSDVLGRCVADSDQSVKDAASDRLAELFTRDVKTIEVESRTFAFRYRSPEEWLTLWRAVYGPVHKAFGTLDEAGQGGLAQALLDLVEAHNSADDGTMVAHSEYLEVIVTKRSGAS